MVAVLARDVAQDPSTRSRAPEAARMVLLYPRLKVRSPDVVAARSTGTGLHASEFVMTRGTEGLTIEFAQVYEGARRQGRIPTPSPRK